LELNNLRRHHNAAYGMATAGTFDEDGQRQVANHFR